MSFSPLENILPPPEHPLETGEEAGWNTITHQLKTRLPEDYRKFIQSYGTGSINGFLFILNPFTENQHINLMKRGDVELDAYRTSKASFPKYYLDDVFPGFGGLLPFGATDNGEVLFWKTIGDANDWIVTVYESRGPKYFEYGGNMTRFLYDLLTGRIVCDVLPKSFIKSSSDFRPIKV